MSSSLAQYKDLFVSTAKEYLATLNEALLRLEKTPDDADAIDAIFRAAHSLKGQSAAMGYEQTGYLCHVVEDVFFEVQQKRKTVDHGLADLLFQALDHLTESVEHIETEGQELPVADVAEQLKQTTGLQTAGAGKSARGDQPPVADGSSAAAAPAESQPAPAAPEHNESITTIPVKVEQLDDIVGSLEELMVHRLSMQALVKKTGDPALSQTQDKINELIELIQFQVMKIRTVPLSMILDHFPRAVRDLGRTLNKQLELHIEGADLELDRTIVEGLDEPLIHLVRNAADHGIGDKGTITISARTERDFAVVSVADDGSGIDWGAIAEKGGVDANDQAAVKKALFSGISTSTKVSLVSGRGVGLETVKKTIEELGGSIDVATTPGQGTVFTLKLPLIVSVVRTLIVRVGSERYAIAATSVDRSLKVSQEAIISNVGQEVFRDGDREIPLVRLRDVFGHTEGDDRKHEGTYAVIINVDVEKIALAVDAVSETLETVIRPLPELLKDSRVFSGVTIVGDGGSVLLINPRGFNREY